MLISMFKYIFQKRNAFKQIIKDHKILSCSFIIYIKIYNIIVNYKYKITKIKYNIQFLFKKINTMSKILLIFLKLCECKIKPFI